LYKICLLEFGTIPQNKSAGITKVILRFVLCLAGILTGEAGYLTGVETKGTPQSKTEFLAT